jgi:fatty acid desaturase
MQSEVTHKEALAMIAGEELASLKELSDAPGILHLSGHLLLLVLTGWSVLVTHEPVWLLASLAHGTLLVFLFTPLHESIHETAFRSPWLNRSVAAVAGFLLLLPPRYFRYFHFAHHRFTQDPAQDPELEKPRPQTPLHYAWHLTGLPYWKAAVMALLNDALGRNIGRYVPASAIPKLILEARLYLASYAVLAILGLAFRLDWILWLWVIPALLGQPFLRAYLLAEHAACPFIADMLANTRTTFCSGLVRYVAWNMPHHTAHHALPTVPFHRLPKLTLILESRLKCTARSYPDAHRQIFRAWRS